MPKNLFVTLKKSDNKYLTYPCKGWLELAEIGSNGSLICGVWRGLKADGSADCPVEVRNVEFEYAANYPSPSEMLEALKLMLLDDEGLTWEESDMSQDDWDNQIERGNEMALKIIARAAEFENRNV